MKKMKKLSAILLSLVMILAMCATAFTASAEETTTATASTEETTTATASTEATETTTTPTPNYSITINGAKAGETYTAYKMLDLSVDVLTNPTAFRYTVNSQWEAFSKTATFTNIFTVAEDGSVSNFQKIQSSNEWGANSKLSNFADAAAAYAKDENNGITAAGSVTIADGQTSDIIKLTEGGYYIITSTLGTIAMIETTPSNGEVTVNEKNSVDTIIKYVKEDSQQTFDGNNNDAQIGDIIEFKTVATIVPRSVNVKIHDIMDSGLTLDTGSFEVYTYDEDTNTNIPYYDATIRTDAADPGDTFTVKVPDAFSATTEKAQTLIIFYKATLNSKAVYNNDGTVEIVPQKNTAKITFGDNQSDKNTTTTTTHSLTVYKHAKDSTANLAGAHFNLKKGSNIVNLVKINDTNYRIADAADTENTVTEFVTVDSGKITVWGLDSDSDYTLYETTAPEGYNKHTDPITVKWNNEKKAFNEIDVENNTGLELPSTGGVGTTVFFIAGGVLIIGAAVFFAVRRKMNSEESA